MKLVPLNLCLASPIYYPYFGGASTRFRKYLPEFKKKGVNTHVLTGTLNKYITERRDVKPDWLTVPVGEIYPKEFVDGFPVYRVRLPYESVRNADYKFGEFVVQSCISRNEETDVVQFVSTSPWMSKSLFQLRKLNIPTLLAYTLITDLSKNPVKRIYQKFLWNIPFKFSNCVVVNSTKMKESLESNGINTRIEVIGNGVDINRFHPAQNESELQHVREKLNIKVSDQVVINVGSIEPRKGTDLLVQAWSELAVQNKSLHLILVGPQRNSTVLGSTDFYNKLLDIVQTRRVADRVHFLDYVPDVETYLRISDLFVFTSLREGLPNAIFEAMASNLPVITTKFDGISHEIGQVDKHYLLLPERDHFQLASLMERVLKSKSLQQSLGNAARKWVEESFSLDSTIDKYKALYQGLVYNKKQN